jgi:hypothetical protein
LTRISATSKTKAVGHVEKDIDVAVDTAKKLLARSHGKDGDISKGVNALVLESISRVLVLGSRVDTEKVTHVGKVPLTIKPSVLSLGFAK